MSDSNQHEPATPDESPEAAVSDSLENNAGGADPSARSRATVEGAGTGGDLGAGGNPASTAGERGAVGDGGPALEGRTPDETVAAGFTRVYPRLRHA